MPKKAKTQNENGKLPLDLEQRLANEEALIRDINVDGWPVFARHVIWPCVALLAIYAVVALFDVWILRQVVSSRDTLLGNLFLLYSSIFIVSGTVLISCNKLYDNRFTAPVWYVAQEWMLLAGVPIFFVLFVLSSGIKQIVSVLPLVAAITAHTWYRKRQTHQSWSYLTLETFVMVEEIAFFYCRLTVHTLKRSFMLLRGIGKALAFMLGERSSRAIPHMNKLNRIALVEPRTDAMSGALRIVHLSDLHLRPDGVGDLENGILQDPARLNALVTQIASCKPDIVIVSGDITDTGSAVDYLKATSLFHQLKIALGPTIPIIAVAGNHDLSVSQPIWAVSLIGRARRVALAVGSASRPFFSAFDVRCARFERFAQELGMNATAPLNMTNLFNYPALELSVVTICTPMPNSWLTFNAIGEFSRDAIAELRALKPRLLRRLVVVCHHHVRGPEGDYEFHGGKWTQAFKHAFLCAAGSTRFADTLIRELERHGDDCVILHGHTHIAREYHLQAPANTETRIPVRCAPSALEGSCPGFMLHDWGPTLDTHRLRLDESLARVPAGDNFHRRHDCTVAEGSM